MEGWRERKNGRRKEGGKKEGERKSRHYCCFSITVGTCMGKLSPLKGSGRQIVPGKEKLCQKKL
jgi:hypothetical protein